MRGEISTPSFGFVKRLHRPPYYSRNSCTAASFTPAAVA